jgi:polyisoprenoid-binding protein YceI
MPISFPGRYLIFKAVPVLFLLAFQYAPGQIHPVAAESAIHFSIKNFGFKVSGTMAPPEGDILFNPDDPGGSSFQVTLKSESINTDNNSRDEHLKSADYFDVKNYPLIHFVSDKVSGVGKTGAYLVTGTLTIKNRSKPVSLPFTAEKSGTGFLFTGSFKMSRKDFGIGGSSTISDELTVEIKVVAR